MINSDRTHVVAYLILDSAEQARLLLRSITTLVEDSQYLYMDVHQKRSGKPRAGLTDLHAGAGVLVHSGREGARVEHPRCPRD